VRIVVFNVARGRCFDVTDEIADELARPCADRDEVLESIADFIAEHAPQG
jgi:hypothetical protein